MNSRRLVFAVVVLSLLCVTQLQAEGAKNFDLSARAASLGGAFTARADDASALYYNPAAIVFLEGIRIKTNLLVTRLTATAYDPATDFTHKSSPFRLQGSFYLTWRATEWLGFGLGGFNPYQAATDWPWNWPGKAVCLRDSLSAYYIRPALSVRLTKFLSIGAGLDFVIARLRLDQVRRYGYFGYSDAYGPFLENRFNLNGRGLGYVFSLLLKFNEKLRIGGRFQQKVTADLEGENQYLGWNGSYISRAVSSRFQTEEDVPTSIFIGQYMHTAARYTNPSEIAVGLMWEVTEKFLLHFEMEKIGWKQVGDLEIDITQDDYILDPDDPESIGRVYFPGTKYITTLKRKDSWNFKTGLEFRLSETLALRGGFASIQSAADADMISPASISLNRRVISLGFGYEGPLFSIWSNEKISELSFDLYGQYIMGQEQASALPGMDMVFDSDHFVIGISVGLNIL